MAKDKTSRGIWETEYKPLPKPEPQPFEGPPPYVGYRNPPPERRSLLHTREEFEPAYNA